MASPSLCLALAMAFSAAPCWSPSRRQRCSRADPEDASGESVVGRAAHSRRTSEVGHRDRRDHRRQISRPAPPSPSWRTFLRTHLSQCASMDFFTVPTATFRVLFVLVILSHDRRRIVHLNVTDHPTAAWTRQQIREAFPDHTAPAYLLRDRDGCYGPDFGRLLESFGTEEVVTAPRSPWQNPFVEHLLGTLRRECLDHVIVWNERSLRRTLRCFLDYYHEWRTHLSLDKDAPTPRAAQQPTCGAIMQVPHVGGLHHHDERRAA